MTRILPSMTRRLAGALFGALLLGVSLGAAPSFTGRLNYQGQLTDSSDQPVADGSYSITFRVYNVASGGSILWSENQNVNVSKGLFNVVLGSVSPVNLGSGLTDDLWIGIDVNSNGEMTPRQQLLPAVYALNALQLQGQNVGTSAFNIVQLDGSGKIPSGLVNGGSVSVPLDLAGSSSSYILRANNSSTGVAISATTASSSLPAMTVDGARYGAIVRTADNVNGVALQATGPGSAYASLIDKVNNAQVFGQAGNSANIGVYGNNTGGGINSIAVQGVSNGGIGVLGNGGNIGVSGTGGTYGLYGYSSGSYGAFTQGGTYGLWAQGGTYGAYVTGSSYGLRAIATSPSYGVFATAPAGGIGVVGDGTWGVQGTSSVGTSNSRGVYGVYSGASTGSGVYGETSATVANSKAVYGHAISSSLQNYGVYGDTPSTASGSMGVYGNATAGSGITYGVRGDTASTTVGSYGVYGKATAAGSTVGVRGEANTAAGIGVSANGYEGVRGDGTFGVHGESSLANGAGVLGVATNANSPGVLARNNVGGPALYAEATAQAISASASDTALPVGDFYNKDNSNSNSMGLRAEAYGIGVVGVARYAYGSGLRGVGGYGVQAQSPYINFWSDTSNNPSYGLYHYINPAPSGGYGISVSEYGASSYGALIRNTSPTGTDAGYALRVEGKFQAPYCSGKYTASGLASSWVMNSTPLGAATANSVEASSNIFITPAINIGSASLYVSSVSAGSFTVSSNTSINNMSFYYWIINE